MDQYAKMSVLGQGTFGAVYLVRSLETKKLYALKQVLLDERSKHRSKEAVLREAKYAMGLLKMTENRISGSAGSELQALKDVTKSILSELKHPNIVAYHNSFFDDNQEYLFIVQDYCDGGTLEDKILDAEKIQHHFEEKQIMQWFIQITMAVQYIHSQKVLHRDLKSQNVFMKKRGNTCKIGDFGISKKMSTSMDRASTFVGTPYYLAPEMCQETPYSSKADVWAIGCILYELCALKPAFDGTNLLSIICKIMKGTPEAVPSRYSASLSDLVNHILTKDPDKRPSACQLLQLPFVKSALNEFVEIGATVKATADEMNYGGNDSFSDSSPDCCRSDDPLSATLTQLNVNDLKPSSARKQSALNKRSVMSATSHRDVARAPVGLMSQMSPVISSRKIPLPPIIRQDSAAVRRQREDDDHRQKAAVENAGTDYEDDFEPDDTDRNSSVSEDEANAAACEHDSSFEAEYCDDFEEYSPEQELEEVLSCAKEVQQQVWNSVDDVTIMDDGPVDIRQLLKPHAEALVGKERFNEILMNNVSSGAHKSSDGFAFRSRGTSEMCHFIEELYSAADGSGN